MGAFNIGCSETLCGDVNGDGMPFTISDMVYLARYILGYTHAIAPWQNSDLDVCGNVNISDLARYIEYFVNGIPEIPCSPVTTCYPDPGDNQVRLDCVVDSSPAMARPYGSSANQYLFNAIAWPYRVVLITPTR